jgi:spermidine synthase
MRWMAMLLSTLFYCSPVLAEPEVLWSRSVEWGQILVVQDGDVRSLLFRSKAGQTVESTMSVSDPFRLRLRYTQQMMAAVALWESRGTVPEPKLLLVGLGGGSLSKAMARQFPDATVTSVEIEPLVVEAARAFFEYKDSDLVRTVVDDARHFLEVTSEQYDVILLDAFDEQGAPEVLRTVEFFALVERHLRPGGVVISNVHYDPWTPARRYLKSAAEVFGSSYLVNSPLSGAAVFSRESLSSLPIFERRAEYEKRYGLPVLDLLSPRLSVDLRTIEPYRER